MADFYPEVDYKPSSFTIMVVDDVVQNLQLLEKIFDQVGYKTTFCKSGSQVLERLQNIEPDLILLNLMVPNIKVGGLNKYQAYQMR